MTKVFALWECLLYRESTKKSEVFKNKHEIHCHDFPSPDLWEGPKDGNIKEDFFHILKSSNKVHYICTLNY